MTPCRKGLKKSMNRHHRAVIAADTISILERGQYTSPSGRIVSLQSDLEIAIMGTVLYEPDTLATMILNISDRPSSPFQTTFEFTSETTLEAALRLAYQQSDTVLCLNFASAKNPGGGFLGGTQAQEESLARSSGLYPCLTAKPAFYDFHRRQDDLLYSDHMIYSPGVPVFRDDAGTRLETPYHAAFITSPAPNAGAIATNQPQSLNRIAVVLENRAEKLLALAAHTRHTRIVLGAWGCGVFRNDPAMVASAFQKHLGLNGLFQAAFERVTFAIPDNKPGRPMLKAFCTAFSMH
jgi:uncharacterized protein (TIGR02452 family)